MFTDENAVSIDIDRLRRDLYDECMGAFFGGGFGGALIEAGDIESASPDELIEIADEIGVDIRSYII